MRKPVFEQPVMKKLLRNNTNKITVKCRDSVEINDETHWQWRTTFNGVLMQHNYWLHYVIDKIMADNPQIASIVEIGTAEGALATVLGLWGVKRDIPIMTIDWSIRCAKQMKVFERLGVKFLNANVLTPDAHEAIADLVDGKPTLLVIDGFHKDMEFNLLVPMIPVGSIVGVHDYESEWFYHDIEDVAKCCEKIGPEKWNELNVQFAVFKKVRDYDVDKC